MRPINIIHSLVLALPTIAGALDVNPPTAIIADGIVIGTTTTLPAATAPVNKYLGIPYAKSPPVRFSPPTKPNSWFLQPLNATAFRPACIQQFAAGSPISDFSAGRLGPAGQSEDCLYVNVFQPGGLPPADGWAVIFWIYGGGLVYGSAAEPWYDGASYAAYENVVVVSLNYRVSVFGFPNSPELPLAERNLGFLDQRLALDWVQRNIRSFGGNPQKVTIFGESAGAISVDALITSPPAPQPFRAAIVHSGCVIGQDILIRGTNYTRNWVAVANATHCLSAASPLACVRAVPALTLKNITERGRFAWGPAVDDVTFTTHGGASRASGRAAKVPLLAGTDANDGSIFTGGASNLNGFLASVFPFNTTFQKVLLDAYPIPSAGINDSTRAISQIFTEYGLQCPQATMANQSAAAGNPTWRFYYNATFPNLYLSPGIGVYHSSEIPMVFGNYPRAGATAQQAALSQFLRGAWARFARNPQEGPGWNALGTFGGTDLGVLGTSGSSGVTVISPQGTGLDARCALFAEIYRLVEA